MKFCFEKEYSTRDMLKTAFLGAVGISILLAVNIPSHSPSDSEILKNDYMEQARVMGQGRPHEVHFMVVTKNPDGSPDTSRGDFSSLPVLARPGH